MSEGGSNIFNYENQEAKQEFVTGEFDKNWRLAIEEHLEKHLGPCEGVFHEILSVNVHIDLYWFKATEERPYVTVVSVGCSDKPLTTPEGAEIFQYVELVLCLPADWQMPDSSADTNENEYWPIRAMKEIIHIPHSYGSFLAYGHTIPNGNPAENYPGTSFNCMLLDQPYHEPEEFSQMTYTDGRILTFLAMYPITEKETEIKLQAGNDRLIELMNQKGILNSVVNVDRPCLSSLLEDSDFEQMDSPEIEEIFTDAITTTREKFKAEQPAMSKEQQKLFKHRRPFWLWRDKKNRINEVFRDAELLRSQGTVVWGQIVQANMLLHDPNNHQNCPAAIIYSLDTYYDGNVIELEEIASSLYAVKGEATTPQLQEFSRILEDEYETNMRLQIPHSLTGGRDVYYTCIMVHRNNLPLPYLGASSFPLLVAPEKTESSMILPYPFWSDAATGIWLSMADQG